MSLNKKLVTLVCMLAFFCACQKNPITAIPLQDGNGDGVIPYDSTTPAAGNWVLQYSDDANGVHTNYWQDSTAQGYRSWASHLVLLKKDSAYWNSAGIYEIAVMGASGTYFIAKDKSDTAYYLSLSFPINNVYVFGFRQTDKNTLLLDDLADMNTVYTYKRKL